MSDIRDDKKYITVLCILLLILSSIIIISFITKETDTRELPEDRQYIINPENPPPINT